MKSPLCYVGGKSQLASKIASAIPPHKTYCEVFAGAAWVFFAKEPSRFEVINDLDGDLVSLYRVLQNHLEEFLRQFKWMLASREWWNDFKRQQEAGGLTDIQRAARYYYLQRQSFGGKVKGRTFAAGPEHMPRVNLLRMEEELSEVHLRLARVVIENLHWAEVIRRYDRTSTFFYLDPPYYKAPYYKHNLESYEDFVTLAEALRPINGKFVLSINDCPEMRQAFSGFNIESVSLRYTIGHANQGEGRELLVSNRKGE